MAPHSSFLRRSAPIRTRGGAKESGRNKYSGSRMCEGRLIVEVDWWWMNHLSTHQLLRASFPPSPRKIEIGIWEIVSGYSSATAPDFHGIPCLARYRTRKEQAVFLPEKQEKRKFFDRAFFENAKMFGLDIAR